MGIINLFEFNFMTVSMALGGSSHVILFFLICPKTPIPQSE